MDFNTLEWLLMSFTHVNPCSTSSSSVLSISNSGIQRTGPSLSGGLVVVGWGHRKRWVWSAKYFKMVLQAHYLFISQSRWFLGSWGKRCHAGSRIHPRLMSTPNYLALPSRVALCRKKSHNPLGRQSSPWGPRESPPQKTRADLFSFFFFPSLILTSAEHSAVLFSILIPLLTASYLLTKQKHTCAKP